MKYSLFPGLELPQPRARPFLKWAGGKRQILKQLLQFLPADVKDRTYHEPFLGAGSLFFALEPRQAFLSDANQDLIRCYQYVRDCPFLISRYLRKHAIKDCERYYYEIRQAYNNREFSAAQGARFIYLNKTCFNGMFRVNQRGLFNVPYGRREKPPLPRVLDLRNASKALKSAVLRALPFQKALESVGKGDFVYLDPPYPPLNGTSYFTHYTTTKFGDTDQQNVAGVAKDLDAAGCLFMVSNADTDRIRRLYKAYSIVSLQVTRYITCKKVRRKVGEIVVANF